MVPMSTNGTGTKSGRFLGGPMCSLITEHLGRYTVVLPEGGPSWKKGWSLGLAALANSFSFFYAPRPISTSTHSITCVEFVIPWWLTGYWQLRVWQELSETGQATNSSATSGTRQINQQLQLQLSYCRRLGSTSSHIGIIAYVPPNTIWTTLRDFVRTVLPSCSEISSDAAKSNWQMTS